MARKHYVGECIVRMSRGYYNVSLIETVAADGYGYITSGSSKVCSTYDRFEAHQIQFMINGWGLAEFTIGNTQRDYIRAANNVLCRHNFNHDKSILIGKYAKIYAKANADCFKAILTKIESEDKRNALTQMWLSKYKVSKGEISQEDYDIIAANLYKVAYAV